MDKGTSLVVFSHLRWNFVYQRPQHLLSRFADVRVLFIEEPEVDSLSAPHWQISYPQANIVVARPITPIAEHGFSDAQIGVIKHMLPGLLEQEGIERHVAWMYTPMALPLLEELHPQLVIYDCMDALDAFLNAPQQLKDREAQLLERADLVFTGGPSLYRRLQDRHAHAYCFPSSVDAAHFGKARETMAEPQSQRAIRRPRLGYFGVIDERVDLPLLDAVAEARPNWQIVMVGPVVKILESSLPRRANIHYLGQQKYDDLPSYLAGWNVCLLPFAHNEATRFISPTKTLEYMAAEKPIVSTSITDVAEPYGNIVKLADDPASFIAACEACPIGGGELSGSHPFPQSGITNGCDS